MPPDLDPDASHWRYALAVYGQEGVSDACLRLQDEAGVDVNVLLTALHTARLTGSAVTEADIAAADAAIAAWRDDIVTALRTIRRRLKEGPAPAPSRLTETLRTAVKQAELRAEQIEMAVLARHFAARVARPVENPPQAGRDGGAEEIARQVVGTVAAFYAGRGRQAGGTVAAELVDAVSAPLVSAAVRADP